MNAQSDTLSLAEEKPFEIILNDENIIPPSRQLAVVPKEKEKLALVRTTEGRHPLFIHLEAGKYSQYNVNTKCVDTNLLEQAIANNPLAGLKHFEPSLNPACNNRKEETISQFQGEITTYLNGNRDFAVFTKFGFNVGINTRSWKWYEKQLKREAEKVKSELSLFRKSGFDRNSNQFNDLYQRFKTIRDAAQRTYEFFKAQKFIQPHTLLDRRYLADILIASPVWYVWRKNYDIRYRTSNNPEIDPTIRALCCWEGNTQQLADFILLFNRRARSFSDYPSKQIVVPQIRDEVIEPAKKFFDILIIATPFLNRAVWEWNYTWNQLPDPFLIGIQLDLPQYIFFLRRWSTTGLRPLFYDMIADTMDFLSKHRDNFKNFKVFWEGAVQWVDVRSPHVRDYKLKRAKNYLPCFIKTLQLAYRQNILFDFLRGEQMPKAIHYSDEGYYLNRNNMW